MKKHSILSLILLGFGITMSSTHLFAKDTDSDNNANEQAYIQEYSHHSRDIPIPIRVETPFVDPLILYEDAPTDVVVAFTVEANGKVSHFKTVNADYYDLISPVYDALSDWRFEPALKDGKPVATRVELKIEFAEPRDDTAPSAKSSHANGNAAATTFSLKVISDEHSAYAKN